MSDPATLETPERYVKRTPYMVWSIFMIAFVVVVSGVTNLQHERHERQIQRLELLQTLTASNTAANVGDIQAALFILGDRISSNNIAGLKVDAEQAVWIERTVDLLNDVTAVLRLRQKGDLQ